MQEIYNPKHNYKCQLTDSNILLLEQGQARQCKESFFFPEYLEEPKWHRTSILACYILFFHQHCWLHLEGAFSVHYFP
ncbi:hypothetical protein PRUPE_3G098600 [Prunus persica]|uniref:Uncharacterized protein n=1 Tax=Prunus persica TaxID=3760 RepID=A0A251PY13_PRUPE|nr:hypothetical protein PRUPE_3G098600 [Prunus persica]